MARTMSDERLQYIIAGLLSVGEPIFDEAGHALEDMRVAASILAKLVAAAVLDSNDEGVWVAEAPAPFIELDDAEAAYLVRLTAGDSDAS